MLDLGYNLKVWIVKKIGSYYTCKVNSSTKERLLKLKLKQVNVDKLCTYYNIYI